MARALLVLYTYLQVYILQLYNTGPLTRPYCNSGPPPTTTCTTTTSNLAM